MHDDINKIYGFFHNCTTKKGYPIAIVGLVLSQNYCEICGKLDEISNCEADVKQDIYNIDVSLAETAKTVCDENVLAVGLNINVSDFGLSTGGVIGNPNVDYSSSDDEMEEISENLWCFSRAGGPGFVILCEAEKASIIRKSFEVNPNLDNFENLTSELEINTYIYVEDGTANGGSIAVSAPNIKKTHKL